MVQQEKLLLRTCTQVLRPETHMLCAESVLRAETHMLCAESVLRAHPMWLQSVLPQEEMLPIQEDARMVQEEELRM